MVIKPGRSTHPCSELEILQLCNSRFHDAYLFKKTSLSEVPYWPKSLFIWESTIKEWSEK